MRAASVEVAIEWPKQHGTLRGDGSRSIGDCRKCQTSTATPAEPGGLPYWASSRQLRHVSRRELASPYKTSTRDGRERIQRTGSCATGYVGKGDKCEALHQDTPRDAQSGCGEV